MNPGERINELFLQHSELIQHALSVQAENLAAASELITDRLLNGGKVIAVSGMGSAQIASTYASQMLNTYDQPRPGLPVIMLEHSDATPANEDSEDKYARQINALGQQEDLLLVIAHQEDNRINQAIIAADSRDMSVIVINNTASQNLNMLVQNHSIAITIPTRDRARTQEAQLLVINCLCDLTDRLLLGL